MANRTTPAYFPKVRLDKRLRRIHGVIEAVHYDAEGRILWARGYLRRFDNFSDRARLSRDQLIARLKAGQRFYLGKPDPLLGNTFTLGPEIRLLQKEGAPFLVAGEETSTERELAGAPEL